MTLFKPHMFVLLCALVMVLAPLPASATACLPGLPCAAPLTPYDPLTPGVAPSNPGPNTTGTFAAISPDNSCDADFMNQIYAKAFLEAERETTMNALLIRKADSVLEYSCFDQRARFQWDYIAPIFTESARWDDVNLPIMGWWGTPPVRPTFNGPETLLDVYMGPDFHDTSLESLVLGALENYISDNFNHGFLGGALGSGIDNNLGYTADAVQDICSHMFDIHYLAKCEDFDENLSFLTFEQLIDLDDPRALPQVCPDKHGITQALLELSQNKPARLGTPNRLLENRYVSFDPIQTHLNLLSFDIYKQCEPPIPTGVRVMYTEFDTDISDNPNIIIDDEYNDMVCPNPSCYLDYNNARCLR